MIYLFFCYLFQYLFYLAWGRAFHTATVFGDSMYVVGGINALAHMTDLWKYQFQSNTWIPITLTTDSPRPLVAAHVTVILNSYVLLIGGFSGDGQTTMQENNIIYKGDCKFFFFLYFFINVFWKVWNNFDTWEIIDSNYVIPSSRFFSAVASTDAFSGIIFGGYDYYNNDKGLYLNSIMSM